MEKKIEIYVYTECCIRRGVVPENEIVNETNGEISDDCYLWGSGNLKQLWSQLLYQYKLLKKNKLYGEYFYKNKTLSSVKEFLKNR